MPTHTSDASFQDSVSKPYVRYSPDVEQEQPDEAALTKQIIEMTVRMSRMMFDKRNCGLRGQHAKSHAVLRGRLSVHEDLPNYLRQGLFAAPAEYDVIVRLSSAPGDILADSISLPKGMAIKVLGVEGEKTAGHENQTTQDFLLTTGDSLAAGDIRKYLQAERFLEHHTADSESLKQAASSLAQGADRLLHAFGIDSKAFTGLGIRNTHLLGETYHSLAALRFGDYIAKLRVVPASANLQPLRDRLVDAEDQPSIHRDLVAAFFRDQAAEYTVQAQLCTGLERMPIEDAAIVWAENESPFLPLARLSFSPQNSFSPARRVYADEVLSFSPWHCLEAHRPLGSIMRVRRLVYAASAQFRQDMNARRPQEPRGINELPD